MKVENISISQLKPYDRNARTHSEEQVQQIAASMQEFGWTNPILIDRYYSIIAGHGRLEAAMVAGFSVVPCIMLDSLSETQVKALRIADNQLALNAGWNEDLLRTELGDLMEQEFEVNLLGFDDSFIRDLLSDGTEEEAPPPADGWEQSWAQGPEISKPGDIWVLGGHRIMCGDSTSASDVAKLVNGKTGLLLHADPPSGHGASHPRPFNPSRLSDVQSCLSWKKPLSITSTCRAPLLASTQSVICGCFQPHMITSSAPLSFLKSPCFTVMPWRLKPACIAAPASIWCGVGRRCKVTRTRSPPVLARGIYD